MRSSRWVTGVVLFLNLNWLTRRTSCIEPDELRVNTVSGVWVSGIECVEISVFLVFVPFIPWTMYNFMPGPGVLSIRAFKFSIFPLS